MDPQEIEDHRSVFEILAAAEALDVCHVDDILPHAVAAGGKFAPPLLLVRGELCLCFDEVETLKAAAVAVTPFVVGSQGPDQSLKEALDAVAEALGTSWFEGAGAAAEVLVVRLRKAFARTGRGVAHDYLESVTERVLLERRAYQMRAVLGERCIRGLLASAATSSSLPVYLPEPLATRLPMCSRFEARLIAEAHPNQDQYEAAATALRAVALARVLPAPGKK
jgi:hypothetical protein